MFIGTCPPGIVKRPGFDLNGDEHDHSESLPGTLMRRIPRVFIPEQTAGTEVVIDPAEAGHLWRVLRLRPGDPAEGFDGNGAVCEGVIARLGPGGGAVAIRRAWREAPPPPPDIVIALALLQIEPMEWALQKAVELGAHTFQPLLSDFVDRKAPRAFIDGRLPRWQRIVRESLKQCRRNFSLRIQDPVTAFDFFRQAGPDPGFLLHLSTGQSLKDALAGRAARPGRVLLAVGPEGGWSETEAAAAAAAGFIAAGLGPSILRAETAAVAALSIAASHYHWEAHLPIKLELRN